MGPFQNHFFLDKGQLSVWHSSGDQHLVKVCFNDEGGNSTCSLPSQDLSRGVTGSDPGRSFHQFFRFQPRLLIPPLPAAKLRVSWNRRWREPNTVSLCQNCHLFVMGHLWSDHVRYWANFSTHMISNIAKIHQIVNGAQRDGLDLGWPQPATA